METVTLTTLQHPMEAVVDIAVDGFAEQHDLIVCSFPAIENLVEGLVTIHS
jgi:hypothetical protein